MQHLCENAMLCCRSHAQALRQVFIPCSKVAGDNKAISDALGQYVGEVVFLVALVCKTVVELKGALIMVVQLQQAGLVEVRQKCPPAALDGETEVSVSCELQEDGEATCDLEAGVGVLKDAEMPGVKDVLDGGVSGFLLVALPCCGLDERQRFRGC
jgi:hypothetical protein